MPVPEMGGEPDFNFEAIGVWEDHFDHAKVADDVLWPIVDECWVGGDSWQKDSKPGMTMMQPNSGEYEGKNITVSIGANTIYCTDAREEPPEEYIRYAVELIVKEEVTDEDSRQVMFGQSIELLEEVDIEVVNEEGEEVELTAVLLAYDDEEIKIQKVHTYTFATDGDWGIETSKVLLTPNNGFSLPISTVSTNDEVPPMLSLPDIEVIQAGCVVFASNVSLRGALAALDDVRGAPVKSKDTENL